MTTPPDMAKSQRGLVPTLLAIVLIAKQASPRFFFMVIGVPIVLALGTFGAEAAVAVLMQATLIVTGVAAEGNLKVPAMLVGRSTEVVLMLLLVAGVMRSLLIASHYYLYFVAIDKFQLRVRTSILEAAVRVGGTRGDRLIAHFSDDTVRAGEAFGALVMLVNATVQTVLIVLALCYLSPVVSMCLLAVGLAFYLPLRLIDRYQIGWSLRASKLWEVAGARFVDTLRNHTMLRVYRAEIAEYAKTTALLRQQVQVAAKNRLAVSVRIFHPQALGVVGVAGIAYCSARWHAVEPGVLLSYLYLVARMSQSASSLFQSVGQLRSGYASVALVAGYAAGAVGDRQWPDRATATTDNLPPPGWQLTDVTFQYPRAPEPVFDGFNLTIKPGSIVMITGPSGVGKSTLVQLLLGELTPRSGSVVVTFGQGEGGSAHEKRAQLFGGIGYVGADGGLLHATVRENLLVGMAEKPDEAFIQAILSSTRCDFVNHLPQGLDTLIAPEQTGLSTGQKQRLALARALIRQPAALLLDEATANLDGDTVAVIIKELRALRGKMTVIGITHGDALLAIADQHVTLEGAGRRDLGLAKGA